jgi:hypothetical protein
MNDLIWTSGHLAWSAFALAVFTGIWLLFFDLVWRLSNTRIGRLSVVMSIGWMIGCGLIFLTLYR